jgi:hypothetical protein
MFHLLLPVTRFATGRQRLVSNDDLPLYSLLFMTRPTVNLHVRPGQRERALLCMVKQERCPALRRMTHRAIRRSADGKLPRMWFIVARFAARRHSFVLYNGILPLWFVTACAGNCCMFPHKGKCRCRMIKCGGLPVLC